MVNCILDLIPIDIKGKSLSARRFNSGKRWPQTKLGSDELAIQQKLSALGKVRLGLS